MTASRQRWCRSLYRSPVLHRKGRRRCRPRDWLRRPDFPRTVAGTVARRVPASAALRVYVSGSYNITGPFLHKIAQAGFVFGVTTVAPLYAKLAQRLDHRFLLNL